MNTKSEKAILYVGALHDHVTESMLFKRFRPAGPIRFIQICRDKKTVPSLIHAYVSFKYRADAERAMVKLNYECLMGQPMRIMWAQRHLTRGSTCVGNLFIENVDKSIDSMGLFELFPISKKDEGYEEEPKGYSFLHFEFLEAANLAMEKLKAKLPNDHQILPVTTGQEDQPQSGQ